MRSEAKAAFFKLNLWRTIRSLLPFVTSWKYFSFGENKNPEENIYCKELYQAIQRQGGTVQFLGHSSTLIQMNGLNVLTDPIAGSFSRHYPRKTRGFDKKALPKIDVVVLSHNHGDHLDLKTLLDLKLSLQTQQPLIVCPKGDAGVLKSKGFTNVHPMDWWDHIILKNEKFPQQKMKITAIPAKHTSGRDQLHGKDMNLSLFNSYFVSTHMPQAQESEKGVLFVGDSAKLSDSVMDEIKKDLGKKIAVSLSPSGPDGLPLSHQSSAEAIEGHYELNPAKTVFIHRGAFEMSADDKFQTVTQRLNRLDKAMKRLTDDQAEEIELDKQEEAVLNRLVNIHHLKGNRLERDMQNYLLVVPKIFEKIPFAL